MCGVLGLACSRRKAARVHQYRVPLCLVLLCLCLATDILFGLLYSAPEQAVHPPGSGPPCPGPRQQLTSPLEQAAAQPG